MHLSSLHHYDYMLGKSEFKTDDWQQHERLRMKWYQKYFESALSLRHGKWILVAQVVLLAAGMVVFIKTIPWLTADEISETSRYESPSPPPPSWVKSFSVNHGDFTYYSDSLASNPVRAWLYIGGILALIVPVQISVVWIFWRGIVKEGGTQT